MTLLLIRHGETALNAARVMQPADTPLSPRGLRQAEALARRLAGEGLAGVVWSDLPRAAQTAQAIGLATGLGALPEQADLAPLLHERHFGDFRGLPYDQLPWDPLRSEQAAPGGESGPAFRARVAAAFAQLVALRAQLGGPLAVVSHGLVIGEILRQHAHWLDPHTARPTHLHNTSVSVLSATAPHTVRLVDCHRHLLGDAQESADSLSGG